MTRLIGRERELEHIARSTRRVVTLVGAAGAGKTRIALEIARRGASTLVRLDEARDDAGVVALFARALGTSVGRDPWAGIAAALAGLGPHTLVLDNAEHIRAIVAAAVARVVEETTELRVLVTSREALDVVGEDLVAIEPFEERAAVELFVEEARKARGDFEPSAAELATIRAIASDLGGLPLAIVLAAARASLFDVAEIHERLPARHGLLRGQGDARAATLRGAIEWSLALLSPSERRVLAHLALFASSFRAVVVPEIVHPDDREGALDAVDALRRKSLVHVVEGTPRRFALYPSVREVCELEVPEGARARRDAYYARESAAWAASFERRADRETAITLGAERATLLRIARELDLDTEVGRARLEVILVAVDAASKALGLAGDFDDVVGAALAREALLSAEFVARLYAARARAKEWLSALPEAVALLEKGLSYAAPSSQMNAQLRLQRAGMLAMRMGRADDAEREYLALDDESRDPGVRGLAMIGLASIDHGRGNVDRALERYEAAVVLQRESGNVRREAHALSHAALIRLDRGDVELATRMGEQAAETLAALSDPFLGGWTASMLSAAYLERGETQKAIESAARASEMIRRAGFPAYAAASDETAAMALRVHGDARAAAALLAPAYETLKSSGFAAHAVYAASSLAGALFALGRESEARLWLARAEKEPGAADEVARARIAIERALMTGEAIDVGEIAERSSAVRVALRLGDGVRIVRKLRVTKDGRAFAVPNGDRVGLETRGSLRKLLARLAQARIDEPGQALSLDALLAAGWPNERVVASAGARRVYVAISSLRKLGLEEFLVRRDDGYLLDPTKEISIEDAF